MRKLFVAMALLGISAFTAQSQAADKIRFAYAVQIHQANMMVLQDYAKKYGVELEVTPMRRYADLQLALMTNQVDVAAIGYVNIGLLQEKNFFEYRAIAGVFNGGQSLVLAKGVKAKTWKDLEGLKFGTAPNSYAELLFKASAKLGGADLSKISTVSFAAGGPPAVAALQNRDIDGFVFWEPTPADAVVKDIGYYSSLDIGANPTRHVNGVLVVNATFLKEHRATVLGLVKAHIDATNALNADRSLYEKVAIQGTGSSPEVVKTAIPHGALDYKLHSKEAKALLQMIHEARITKDDTSAAVDKQFDYSLLEEATGKSKNQLGGE